MNRAAIADIYPYLPSVLKTEAVILLVDQAADPEEIRLRVGRRPSVRYLGEEHFIAAAPPLHEQDIEECLLLLCGSSFYAMEEELRRGFITLKGGHRAGFCGSAVLQGGRIKSLKDIFGINLRLARFIPEAADGCMTYLFTAAGKRPLNSLIVSPPGGGKTTVLRAIAWRLAEGEGCPPFTVALADERMELAGCGSLPLGNRCDVLSGAGKLEAIRLLLRSMSPQVIICDELGSLEDAKAVREAAASGVKIIASVHGATESELQKRPFLQQLLQEGIFDRLIFLTTEPSPGTLLKVLDGDLRLIKKG